MKSRYSDEVKFEDIKTEDIKKLWKYWGFFIIAGAILRFFGLWIGYISIGLGLVQFGYNMGKVMILNDIGYLAWKRNNKYNAVALGDKDYK